MLITGNTGEKYCRNNNDCKIETGCGCADGNKECQKGDDVWKTLNDFHPNCYCINHRCKRFLTATKTYIEKIVKGDAAEENMPNVKGFTGEQMITKIRMYPMYDLNGVIRKYWVEMICENGVPCKSFMISNLPQYNYPYSTASAGGGPTEALNKKYIPFHIKNHPDDKKIKSIRFLSFFCYNTPDAFLQVMTNKNTYYYGPDPESTGKFEDGGKMALFREMSKPEIEKYNTQNVPLKIKDKEKYLKIWGVWNSFMKSYENMQNKDSIKVEFMNKNELKYTTYGQIK